MLSAPLEQHILDYKPSRGFVILAFTMFDGSANPYDHIFHYNQAMTRNAGNDQLFDSCHGRCIRINKIYILNPTVVVKLLQYSGSRVEHMDGFSSYKLIYSESKW